MKKAVFVLTIFIMSIQMIVFQPVEKAHAVGVDTVVKLVGGKAVVRALAEKAGMALSKKQVDNVASFIQKKTYDGDQKAIDFVNKANSLTGTTGKTGFKKYVLEPLAWLSGLDYIMLAVGAFSDGYSNNTPVPFYGVCMPSTTGNTAVDAELAKTTYNHIVKGTQNYGTNVTYVAIYQNASVPYLDANNTLSVNNPGYYRVYKFHGGTNYEFLYNGLETGVFGMMVVNTGIWDSTFNESVCNRTPVADDVVNVTNVNPVVMNYFDNDTYNTNTSYNLEFEIPESVNFDDMTPWNEQDPTLGDVMKPIAPDSDGDGIPDDVDEYPNDPTNEPTDKPEGSSWWEWLLGPLKAIGDFFKDVGGFLLGILVPSADSVTGIFNGISDSFKAKIPIADQLGNFFGQVENIQTNDTPVAPTFEITMPPEYGGETFPIIDFSYFDEWRVWVLNFIRFAAWFIFLKRLYNRIPKMVY